MNSKSVNARNNFSRALEQLQSFVKQSDGSMMDMAAVIKVSKRS